MLFALGLSGIHGGLQSELGFFRNDQKVSGPQGIATSAKWAGVGENDGTGGDVRC
jgi:hypothetical protein